MKKTGLLLLAGLAAIATIGGLASAATPRTIPFRVTFPVQASVSNGGSSALLSGRFRCAKPSEILVQAWVFQRRSGALANGRFPVHAATPTEKALALCTGTSRPWTIAAAVKDTAPGRMRAGAATACYVVALRAHSLYTTLSSHCAPVRLR